jgi:hypothetical protein
MWMEETIGERINVNRTAEAVATGADEIAVGCPFCNVMLSDGLTAQQAEGKAGENVKIIDVAQMLLASVRRGQTGADAVDAVDEGPAVVEEAEAITAAAAGAGATEELLDDVADEVEATEQAAEAGEAEAAQAEVIAEATADSNADAAAEAQEAVTEATDGETPAEHLMEHNGDLDPTDEDARDEEADELKHEHERDEPNQG